jgi:CHAT domain-containing protein
MHTLLDPDGFLGDRFAVSQVPSAMVASLLADRDRREPPPPMRSVLAVAGPTSEEPLTLASADGLVPSGASIYGPRVLRSTFLRDEVVPGHRAALRFAGNEASFVARWFSRSTVLSGVPDAERQVSRLAEEGRLRTYDVIHVAAHTVIDTTPEQCALVIGSGGPAEHGEDGLLDVEEVLLGWDLDADLLVLSGCHSARTLVAARGEHIGFTPALFAVGARSVLSSLWPVDDRATTILMDRFYDNLMGGSANGSTERTRAPMSPSFALREARRHVREIANPDGTHPFEHPAYWGGFILIGMPPVDDSPPGRSNR